MERGHPVRQRAAPAQLLSKSLLTGMFALSAQADRTSTPAGLPRRGPRHVRDPAHVKTSFAPSSIWIHSRRSDSPSAG
jgi:hypothetical protein